MDGMSKDRLLQVIAAQERIIRTLARELEAAIRNKPLRVRSRKNRSTDLDKRISADRL